MDQHYLIHCGNGFSFFIVVVVLFNVIFIRKKKFEQRFKVYFSGTNTSMFPIILAGNRVLFVVKSPKTRCDTTISVTVAVR